MRTMSYWGNVINKGIECGKKKEITAEILDCKCKLKFKNSLEDLNNRLGLAQKNRSAHLILHEQRSCNVRNKNKMK